jgi:hypothetical protein
VRSDMRAAQLDFETHSLEVTDVPVPQPGRLAVLRPMAQQGIPERPFSRLVIIQAWRAFSLPPQDRPLAAMDATTLGESDTFVVTRRTRTTCRATSSRHA